MDREDYIRMIDEETQQKGRLYSWSMASTSSKFHSNWFLFCKNAQRSPLIGDHFF